MAKVIAIYATKELQRYERAPQLPPLDAEALAIFPPDRHLILADGSLILAHLSLWWTNTPAYPGERLGFIGHYAARDATASQPLLSRACSELATQGCTLAVGPMNGNTLQSYRFLIERGEQPPFLLEPDNPDEWPQYWQDQGFSRWTTYFSARNNALDYEDPRIPRAAQRLEQAGVTIRPMVLADFTEELRRIYQVTAGSFGRNFLYTPFTEEEYLRHYLPYRRYVVPEMILLAEFAGKPVGFVFNIPDYLQAQRGQEIDTLILKTCAVLPGRYCAGLGNVLVAASHRIARDAGYRQVIHALMHERNNSLLISQRFARPFRRYALFARALHRAMPL